MCMGEVENSRSSAAQRELAVLEAGLRLAARGLRAGLRPAAHRQERAAPALPREAPRPVPRRARSRPPRSQRRELLEEAARVLGEPLLAELPADDWRTVLDAHRGALEGAGQAGARLRRVPVDGGGVARAAVAAAGAVGPPVEALGQGDAVPVRLVHRLHGARGARREEPVVRPAHRADSPEARSAIGEAAAFHPALVPASPRAGVLRVRRRAAVPAARSTPQRSFEANVQANHPLRVRAAVRASPSSSCARSCATSAATTPCSSRWRAGGARRATSRSDAGLPERSLHYYLEQLVSLGFVGRRFPLTGARGARAARASSCSRTRSCASGSASCSRTRASCSGTGRRARGRSW